MTRNMMKIILFALLALMITGCIQQSNIKTLPTTTTVGSTTAATIKVKIDNYSFEPETVNIHRGDTVKWKNDDNVTHVVYLNSSKPLEEFTVFAELDPGESVSHIFAKAGTFEYYCPAHGGKNVIIVE